MSMPTYPNPVKPYGLKSNPPATSEPTYDHTLIAYFQEAEAEYQEDDDCTKAGTFAGRYWDWQDRRCEAGVAAAILGDRPTWIRQFELWMGDVP
jgi:hypothetical protein